MNRSDLLAALGVILFLMGAAFTMYMHHTGGSLWLSVAGPLCSGFGAWLAFRAVGGLPGAEGNPDA